jgi:hypothetical protein
MIELKQTGFMSNRGRQNVASYFVTNSIWIGVGAAYFESQLIDYDVCSNWGNWAYLAGVGNDPRSTVISIFKNKRMIMIRIGVSVICGCRFFVSQRVTKLSKLFEFIIITRKGFNFVCVLFLYLFFLSLK